MAYYTTQDIIRLEKLLRQTGNPVYFPKKRKRRANKAKRKKG